MRSLRSRTFVRIEATARKGERSPADPTAGPAEGSCRGVFPKKGNEEPPLKAAP